MIQKDTSNDNKFEKRYMLKVERYRSNRNHQNNQRGAKAHMNVRIDAIKRRPRIESLEMNEGGMSKNIWTYTFTNLINQTKYIKIMFVVMPIECREI